ncbi:MAG: GTP-binding protein, partial [Patescibacteria group bacterium]|nr:GTP-binding protein [Patescibacteria group bacterium]
RKTNVAEKEAGGITQRIGAYEVLHKTTEGKEQRLSFIDTPGHEAFGSCRENSLCAADVGILVVAVDEGAKPQTVEAFKQLTASKTPFVVAFTKTDKQNADLERAKQSLAEKEIFVEGYGGSVPSASVSAKNGEGVGELLDLVLLLAEMHEAPCEAARAGEGVVIEAERGSAQGIAATLVVKNGTVRKGQVLLAGGALSVIRTLTDYAGKPIEEAWCGRIARVGGWSELPSSGDAFCAYENKKEAERALEMRTASIAHNPKKPETPREANTTRVVVPLVVKADTAGSIEAIKHELAKLQNEKIEMKIIGAGLGSVGEGDLRLAGSAREAVLIGFNVGADGAATQHAKAIGIPINLFDIIYRLSDFLAEIA